MSLPSCIISLRTSTNTFLIPTVLSLTGNVTCLREASKKAGTSTRGGGNRGRPKHLGVRVNDGGFVQAGTLLAVQKKLRFHPGLNVGFGRNGTLYALHPGKVFVTCEKANPNWEHSWVKKHYSGREDQTIFKKYFNVITEPQHNRFRLLDKV